MHDSGDHHPRNQGEGTAGPRNEPAPEPDATSCPDSSARLAALLAAVTEALAIYLDRGDWRTSNALLLRAAISQSESEYGFLGVAVDGPGLRVLAHEGLIWDDEVNRAFYDRAIESYRNTGYLQFDSFENLFGIVMKTGEVVITNEAASDPRAGGLPPGHPPLRSFLGVPIRKGRDVVGMIGLANRPGGFTGREQADIESLVRHAGVLCDSYRRQLREESLEAERQRGQERQRLLALELDHRVKNNLASVVSLAQLTGESVDTKEAFVKIFTQRVAAMARAHESLASGQWQGARLLDLIRLALSPFAEEDERRIRLRGADVLVESRAAQPMALVLHELATNAATHGALSAPHGFIEMDCGGAADGRIHLRWTERGGPRVAVPDRLGTGLSLVRGLIERELAGRLELTFDPGGLICTIEAPFPAPKSPPESPPESRPESLPESAEPSAREQTSEPHG